MHSAFVLCLITFYCAVIVCFLGAAIYLMAFPNAKVYLDYAEDGMTNGTQKVYLRLIISSIVLWTALPGAISPLCAGNRRDNSCQQKDPHSYYLDVVGRLGCVVVLIAYFAIVVDF
ncbi:hypothetical protein F4677DRAFT_417112 [Hypoxylon crocopeplum]|nr:hypothetical protein F4677DRAFT_417112 [Hypoxylon crocopeplum]